MPAEPNQAAECLSKDENNDNNRNGQIKDRKE